VTPLYTLIIHYTNGSDDRLPFSQYAAVRDFYQHSISYSGGRVRRVEVAMHDGGVRAIWDIGWSPQLIERSDLP
jgi:hypothetical protein